jgi:hypothetical protein
LEHFSQLFIIWIWKRYGNEKGSCKQGAFM